MGLDMVEIVMDIENEFRVALSNEEATKCITPRILPDVVLSKVRQTNDQSACR